MNKADKKSEYKKRVISLANQKVQEFAGKNVAILQEKIIQLCLALDEKKAAQAARQKKTREARLKAFGEKK